MKIRIVDIAKKAGVSVGTVDRIIHQRGRYSEASNEKVQKAIKELRYAPNLMARNLALKQELHLVCLLPDFEETPYWERPFTGVKNAMAELASFKVNIETVLFSPRREDFKSACNQALSMAPDGVVYVPMFFNESTHFAKQLTQNNIPFVHINIFQPEVQPMSFVGQDPIAAGKAAASLCHLALKEGNSILITYISEEKQEYAHLQERIEGFMQYLKQQNINDTQIYHLNINIGEDETEYDNQLMQHLKEHRNTQIIYVPNSRAHKIASILKKHDLKSIMVVGFDTLTENMKYLKEGTIHFLIGQQSKTQGYRAVMSLFNALFRKEKIPPLHLLPIDILNRENIDFYEGLMSK
jgi:LacI family transcriptional regulator